MTDLYLYWKSLHIIFVVTWFAGLFYIVRLFVYQIEVQTKSENERLILAPQLALMSHRLWYIITWPSSILAILFAGLLLWETPYWLTQSWMHLKLGFVILLLAYHIKCHYLFKQLQHNTCKWTSTQMRLWNEGATLILFSVVFLVVLKDSLNWIYGVLSLFLFSFLLMMGVRIYKKWRTSKNN